MGSLSVFASGLARLAWLCSTAPPSTGLYRDIPSFAGLFHVVSSQASLQFQISELFKAALLAAASDLQGAALDPLVATADPRFGDYQCKVDEI